MRTVVRAALALCVAAAFAQPACAQEQAQARTEWEYLTLTKEEVVKRGKDLAGGLNALGKEGWELAAVTCWPQNDKRARVGADYYFKRPRRAAKPAEAKPEPKEVTKSLSAGLVGLWAKLPQCVRRQFQPAQPPNADPPG
jgi:hypothetical protein